MQFGSEVGVGSVRAGPQLHDQPARHLRHRPEAAVSEIRQRLGARTMATCLCTTSVLDSSAGLARLSASAYLLTTRCLRSSERGCVGQMNSASTWRTPSELRATAFRPRAGSRACVRCGRAATRVPRARRRLRRGDPLASCARRHRPSRRYELEAHGPRHFEAPATIDRTSDVEARSYRQQPPGRIRRCPRSSGSGLHASKGRRSTAAGSSWPSKAAM